jgi:glycosyltransferase involved in cell wall biosynthesis
MKKRICLIAPKFINYIGGVETHAYEFDKWFSNNKNYGIATIITLKKVKDGIKVKRKKISSTNTRVVDELTNNFDEDLKIILSNSPKDTAIYFFNSTNSIPIINKLVKKRKNAKIILRSGGTDIVAGWIGDENNKSKDILENRKFITEVINNSVDCLIVNSKFSEKRCLDIGINKNKIKVITGGVDCNRYRPVLKKDSNKINFLHVSRFVECKGTVFLLEAFKKAIGKTKKELRLTLVGDGPQRKAIEESIKRLDLEPSVTLTGAIKVEDVSNYFNMADIFVHLPITLLRKERGGQYEHVESMGRVFCEATAAGIPSIAFSVGGVPEVVDDNRTGFLLKEGDMDGASEKMALLADNPSLRKDLGRNARERALKEFDWDIIFNKYLEIFNDK